MVSGGEDPKMGDTNYDPLTTGIDRIEIYNPAVDSWRVVAKNLSLATTSSSTIPSRCFPTARCSPGPGILRFMGFMIPVRTPGRRRSRCPWAVPTRSTLLCSTVAWFWPSGPGRPPVVPGSSMSQTGNWTEVGRTPGVLNTGKGDRWSSFPAATFAVGAVPHWLTTQTAIYRRPPRRRGPADPSKRFRRAALHGHKPC